MARSPNISKYCVRRVVGAFALWDETVDCAMQSVRRHVPDIGALGEQLTFSLDGMVIGAYVGNGKVTQRRAEVLDFGSLQAGETTHCRSGYQAARRFAARRASAVAQLQCQHGAGQQQRHRVPQHDRHISDQHAVHEP